MALRTTMDVLDHGEKRLTFRFHRISGQFPLRRLVVCVALVLATIVAGVLSLSLGKYGVSVDKVFATLLGVDTGSATQTMILQWRLPRVLFAIASGIALALSGAIFQSLTKNPLGSPDIIGFSAGSYTGAVVVMLYFGSARYLDIAAGALIGGFFTALAVYVLAIRRGRVDSFRLIIIGIGIGALLNSLNSGLMLYVSVESAMLAASWAAGSFSSLGYEQFLPLLLCLLILLVILILIAPSLEQLELGDDAAHSTGVRATLTRGTSVIIAVALTALVTAAAGPISFIALSAPQIARRLVKGTGPELFASACVGAFILLLADIIAQALNFQVGVITVIVGGGYLIWLLVSEFRRKK